MDSDGWMIGRARTVRRRRLPKERPEARASQALIPCSRIRSASLSAIAELPLYAGYRDRSTVRIPRQTHPAREPGGHGTISKQLGCDGRIDACDQVMDKIDKPRGLIRYSSENAILHEKKKVLTPRVIGYSGVLTVLIGIFIVLLSMRADLETSILRERGTLYQELPDNKYSNIYEVKVINKTFDDIAYEVQLIEPTGELISLGGILSVPGQSLSEGRYMVQLTESQLEGLQTELTFAVFANGKRVETVKTGFLGPSN